MTASTSLAQTDDPAAPTSLLELLRLMILCRETEAAIERLHHSGRFRGSFHSSMGHEGAAVGVCSQLRPDDIVTTTHRGHAHALARGLSIRDVLAELAGMPSGVSKGKGGSMHLHSKEHGFLGSNAIVAGSMPWVAGAAWAARILEREKVGVAFFGDGAASHGTFHETLRMARVLTTPTLFVCENNGLAHSMPSTVAFGEPGSIARMVEAGGIRAESIDGANVQEVTNATSEILGEVRTGIPAFLEIQVTRGRAHSLHDPEYRYREKGAGGRELETRDPILNLRRDLEREHESAVDEVVADVEAEIADALKVLDDHDRHPVGAAMLDIDSEAAS